jgi:hypothetical protein
MIPPFSRNGNDNQQIKKDRWSTLGHRGVLDHNPSLKNSDM